MNKKHVMEGALSKGCLGCWWGREPDYDPCALGRTGPPHAANLPSQCRRGEPVAVYDGRPNGELVLATGNMEYDNPADCQIVQVASLPPCLKLLPLASDTLHAGCPCWHAGCARCLPGSWELQWLSADCFQLWACRLHVSCQMGCAQTGLVQTDRLYSAKKQLVEAMGFDTVQVG